MLILKVVVFVVITTSEYCTRCFSRNFTSSSRRKSYGWWGFLASETSRTQQSSAASRDWKIELTLDMNAKDGGGEGVLLPTPSKPSAPELPGSPQPTAASMATSKNSGAGAKPTLVRKIAEPKSPKVRTYIYICIHMVVCTCCHLILNVCMY